MIVGMVLEELHLMVVLVTKKMVQVLLDLVVMLPETVTTKVNGVAVLEVVGSMVVVLVNGLKIMVAGVVVVLAFVQKMICRIVLEVVELVNILD